MILLLFGFWQIVQATELLLDYPEIQGIKPGVTTNLPEIIKYIYMFALGAAGFVALLAILIGAIMYVFSTGNPSKAKDAKDRILSALLGILILLISVLLLRIINPDLINIGFDLPIITPVAKVEETKNNTACLCGTYESNEFKGCSTYNVCAIGCENICGKGEKYLCSFGSPKCHVNN